MASFVRKIVDDLKYGKPIVIVSGLPRSGTSLAMKMLDAGGMPQVVDGIRTADEDNPKGYFEDERVKDLHKMTDKTWVRDARGKALKVISFLLKDLPDTNRYKVVFMRRHLDEVLASQNKMLDHRGEKNETPDDQMKKIYEEHLKQVYALLEKQPHFEVLYVDYTGILEDPRGQATRIRDFLGVPFDVEKMAAVADKALYRNRAARTNG
ncbi:MAG: sulfotransferase [Candidatus Eisenbacteria bacterium]|nr:sulfotransferase [Candidatus Eisenbacteria bacterium]